MLWQVNLEENFKKNEISLLTNSKKCAILKAQRARVRQPESDGLTHESRVRPHLMTPTARSPVTRYINVNQQLRASERNSAEDGRTDAKPPHLRESAVRRGQIMGKSPDGRGRLFKSAKRSPRVQLSTSPVFYDVSCFPFFFLLAAWLNPFPCRQLFLFFLKKCLTFSRSCGIIISERERRRKSWKSTSRTSARVRKPKATPRLWSGTGPRTRSRFGAGPKPSTSGSAAWSGSGESQPTFLFQF